MTSETEIMELLLNRAAQISDYALAFPGVEFTEPTDSSPYVEIAVLPNTTERFSVGAGDAIHTGILQLSLCTCDGRGVVEPTREAESLMDVFPQDLRLMGETTKIRIYKRGSIGTSFPRGGYRVTPVTIYYRSET